MLEQIQSASKPIIYAQVPATFDQSTQYVVQLEPVEELARIFVGVEIRELESSQESDGGMFGATTVQD